MKGRVRLAAALACAAALASGAALRAEDDEKSWSLDLGYDHASRYMFRGVDLLDGEPYESPYVTWTVGDFSLYYSGYYGKVGKGGPRYEEADVGADYTFKLGESVSLTTGAIAYLYPKEDSGTDTTELYATLAVDTFLAPTVSVYWDVDAYDGGYASFGLSHSVPLGSRLSVELSAAVGLDFGYNDPDTSGDLNDVLLGVSLPWQLGEHFYLKASAQRSIALSVLDDLGQDDVSFYTVGGGFSF